MISEPNNTRCSCHKKQSKNLCNILHGNFYILQTSPLVNILLKDKWIHFAYLELKYGEFTHITLIFCNNIGIMSGILAGRRVLSSFSQCSFKICKNSIFDLASCIPSWNTKFHINTVVSRYYSCNDSVTNTSPAIPKLDSCLHLHIKLIIQANHTLAHIIPIHTMSCYNKWLLLVLYHPCSAIKDSNYPTQKNIEWRPHKRMIQVPLLKVKKPMQFIPKNL
jgi:hypothetical protein